MKKKLQLRNLMLFHTKSDKIGIVRIVDFRFSKKFELFCVLDGALERNSFP
jgi:hypothetical protein